MKCIATVGTVVVVFSITSIITKATLPSSVSRTFHDPGFTDRSNSCLPTDDKGSLELKCSKSDVVMTGTILNIMREDSSWLLDGASNQAERQSGRTVSALVKVWSVMKGSLEDVIDKSRKYKRFKRSAKKNHRSIEQSDSDTNSASGAKITKKIVNTAAESDFGSTNHIVELHGLRNSYFCESFLQEGDTRVFFLGKRPDHRPSLERAKRSSKKEKRRKRKCKKKGKQREKNKTCSKRRFVTLEKKKVSKARSKQSKEPPKRIRTNSNSRSQPTDLPSTLLVNGEPTRITLTNLKNVQSVIHVR